MVHPHGCGENDLPEKGVSRFTGPSPRVWGKRFARKGRIAIYRSIPTGVGKTIIAVDERVTVAVHPHGCGENDDRTFVLWSGYGPSPRVWGKRIGVFNRREPLRSIPTGVGKTFPHCSGLGLPTVHPHGCGENVRRSRLILFITVHPHGCGENNTSSQRVYILDGPSPRVWGKRVASQLPPCLARSIPTGVGKTVSAHRHYPDRTVHPHGCGENGVHVEIQEKDYGPSPRVWGKPPQALRRTHLKRSIPTGVGKTEGPLRGPYSITVHPHGCGENELEHGIWD